MAITGIGGLFFRSQNPEATLAWYKTHLGIAMGKYGVWDQQAGPTVFAPFPDSTDYFPADKQWMINFRVDALDPLMESLRQAGIEVVTKPEWNSPETGRFARIQDPEGNVIELWEEPATP
jgi:predicted enzyme related to lactoylglutathione lyase